MIICVNLLGGLWELTKRWWIDIKVDNIGKVWRASVMAGKFSVDEIQQFHKLKTREQQLLKWRASIDDEMERLKRQKRHQSEELEELQATINKKFAALNSQSELFSLATDWSSGLSVDEVKKGMSSEKKKRLFPQIMSEYLAVHPKAESVPFTWIKSHLAEKYKIECRSISNFFVGILDEYELVGGNRNRAVKCE